MSIYWLGTVSGHKIDFFDPDPKEFTIEDIATGLANNCRFSGQLQQIYSVASHSLEVSQTVYRRIGDPVIALQGLLHDASEAYTNDICTPLKLALGKVFTDIEHRLQTAIYHKFGIPEKLHYHVKEADIRWCVTERNQFQPDHCKWPGFEGVEPYPTIIEPVPADLASARFLHMFYTYRSMIKAHKDVSAA